MTVVKTEDKELEHPTTFRIYMYIYSNHPNEVGIREIQRQLNIKSPGNVKWHIDKLEASNYIEQVPNNKYLLSNKETQRKEIQIPLTLSSKIFQGIIVPPILFISFFLLFMGIMSLILVFVDPLLGAINGIVGLAGGLGLAFREYKRMMKQIDY